MSQFGNPDSFKAYGDQTTPTSSGTVQWQCIFAMEDHQLARQFFHPRLSIGTPPIIFSMVTWDHSVGASSLRGVPPRSSITELVPSLNGYRPRFLGACIREVNESWLKKKKKKQVYTGLWVENSLGTRTYKRRFVAKRYSRFSVNQPEWGEERLTDWHQLNSVS